MVSLVSFPRLFIRSSMLICSSLDLISPECPNSALLQIPGPFMSVRLVCHQRGGSKLLVSYVVQYICSSRCLGPRWPQSLSIWLHCSLVDLAPRFTDVYDVVHPLIFLLTLAYHCLHGFSTHNNLPNNSVPFLGTKRIDSPSNPMDRMVFRVHMVSEQHGTN